VVKMPDWFESLNKDFRYQLTLIGAPRDQPLCRRGDLGQLLQDCREGEPGAKVSWQVTGIRQDAYANGHRIPVEEAKSEKERGLYLHPELFGASTEKSIAAFRHAGAMKMAKEGNAKLAGVK
jgi:hypothetical protein